MIPDQDTKGTACDRKDGPERFPASRWRRFALPGIVCLQTSYFLFATVASHFPSRWVLAQHEAQFGIDAAAYLIAGLAVDVRDKFFTFTILAVAIATAVFVLFRKRFRTFDSALRTTSIPAASLLFMLHLTLTVAAAEHKIERGLFPTAFDVSVGAQDWGFFSAALRIFLLARYTWPTILVTLAFVALSMLACRTMQRPSPALAGRVMAFSFIVGSAIFFVSFGLHRASPLIFRSIPNWRTVESPLVVYWSFGSVYENIRLGSRWLFEHLNLPGEPREPGAEVLGFAPESTALLAEGDAAGACRHPLAMRMAIGEEGTPEPRARELSAALDTLSKALFQGRASPVRLWHVVLESFRGDDLHALNERAPFEIAPFTNRAYGQATSSQPTVLAARKVYQAGTRTSQGLAALLCGMGSLPFGLSLARDFGLVPIRCLPDVLVDASFRTAFYYGSNPSFDNMLTFMNYHGFDRVMAEKDYVEKTPHKGWSVPDGIVFTQAFEDSERQPPSQSQYNLVLSLTNHFPFSRPEDFPPQVGARVDAAVRSGGYEVKRSDFARLETFAYTDHALELLVNRIERSPSVRMSIVVMTADHSASDFFLWRASKTLDPQDRAVALAHIPLLVFLPNALVEASIDPESTRRAARAVNRILKNLPLSQNDVPLLILRLLSHSSAMAQLHVDWRWHTIGGQQLSPHFRVPGHPEAVVMGIDGASMVFLVTSEGELAQTRESARPTINLEQAVKVGPPLRPAAAFLSDVLSGYAKWCWPVAHVRAIP